MRDLALCDPKRRIAEPTGTGPMSTLRATVELNTRSRAAALYFGFYGFRYAG